MKISRDKLIENRQRILDAAARMFRERGFEAVTVSEVMKAADLTHGGFYNHFKSKDDLIAKTFAHALLPAPTNDGSAEPAMVDYARAYLSGAHRDAPGSGCMLSALAAEGARCNDETRKVMGEATRAQIARFAATAPGTTAEARRRAAIARWSAMLGAVILARAIDDTALSDEILSATLEAVEAPGS